MKKKLDLKMLENADKDTLDTLTAKYRAVDDKEAEKLFQRITNNNEDFDEEVHVHGVEIYHRTIWRKALAVACTCIIAVGAAAGGTYYFSKLKKDRTNINTSSESEDDENVVTLPAEEYGTIYEKLKANKDSFRMNTSVLLFNDEECSLNQNNDEKEKFFEYVDKLDMKEINEDTFVNEEGGFELVYASELQKVPKSIRFSFKSDDDTSFTLDIYENGHAVWTEKNMGSEKTADFSISDGEKIFNDLLKMYDIDTDSITCWDYVSADEIESFIDMSYYVSSNTTAYKFKDGKQEEFYIDQEEFKKIVLSCDWVRATEFKPENHYSVCGVSISEDGYMTGTYNGCVVVYKLQDDFYLDKLSTIWQSDEETVDDPSELLNRIRNETTVQWFEGPTLIPQAKLPYDTITRYYTITDTNSFIDELSSLEWEKSTSTHLTNENGHYRDRSYYISDGSYQFGSSGYFGIVGLYPKGYMSIEKDNEHYYYFKLKNESDAEKITQMADKYFVMDESSKLADMISQGVTNFENLKAHYTYNFICDGKETSSISGELSVDAKNNKMHMTGEGTWRFADELQNVTSEIVMIGHDDSAFKVLNKDTSEEIYSGIYSYSNGYAMAPPEYHYIYFCKDLENALTPRFLDEYSQSGFDYEIREVDGNTEIIFGSSDSDPNERTRILLNPNGQLLSYEVNTPDYKKSFKLDNYVFDSPDFTMEDVEPIYENIKKMNE